MSISRFDVMAVGVIGGLYLIAIFSRPAAIAAGVLVSLICSYRAGYCHGRMWPKKPWRSDGPWA